MGLLKSSASLLCRALRIVSSQFEEMTFSKLFTLAVTTSTLATGSVLGQRYSNFLVKRSDGTVAGAEDGTSYFWNSTGTSAQCPTLLSTDLQTSLLQFDALFPPESV